MVVFCSESTSSSVWIFFILSLSLAHSFTCSVCCLFLVYVGFFFLLSQPGSPKNRVNREKLEMNDRSIILRTSAKHEKYAHIKLLDIFGFCVSVRFFRCHLSPIEFFLPCFFGLFKLFHCDNRQKFFRIDSDNCVCVRLWKRRCAANEWVWKRNSWSAPNDFIECYQTIKIGNNFNNLGSSTYAVTHSGRD